jgi:hypothetical protein
MRVPAPREKRQRNESYRDRVGMTAPGEFPDHERVPRVQKNAFSSEAERHEQLSDGPNRNCLENNHREFHPRHALADPRRQQENDLRDGRIDRVRIVTPVDARIDRLITQMGQFRRRGNVAKRIDARRLDTSGAMNRCEGL